MFCPYNMVKFNFDSLQIYLLLKQPTKYYLKINHGCLMFKLKKNISKSNFLTFIYKIRRYNLTNLIIDNVSYK